MKKKVLITILSSGIIYFFISLILPNLIGVPLAAYQSYKDSTKSKPPLQYEYQQSELFDNPGPIDFPKVIKKANKAKKPILLYFQGYACVNAVKMEENILSKNEVTKKLIQDFIFVNVYVDDQNEMPEKDWIFDEKKGKTIKKVGDKNAKFQRDKFNSNVCPYFVILDVNGNEIKDLEYTADVKEFKEFLIIQK